MTNSVLQIPIPMVILKFIQFKEINGKLFRQKWHANSRNMLRSEPIQINPKIAKTTIHIKKYFQNLIDLKPHRNTDNFNGGHNYSLGTLLFIAQFNQEFLLKIIMQPDQKVIFKIALASEGTNKNLRYKNLYKIEEFIIQTLVFLFEK